MSARTRTVEVDFDISTPASPAEWREALAELESRVPEEHRDTLCIYLRGEISYDVAYVEVEAYYEVEETPEEIAAREERERERELRVEGLRSQIRNLEQGLEVCYKRLAAELEKEGGAE